MTVRWQRTSPQLLYLVIPWTHPLAWETVGSLLPTESPRGGFGFVNHGHGQNTPPVEAPRNSQFTLRHSLWEFSYVSEKGRENMWFCGERPGVKFVFPCNTWISNVS